ncbi:MAG: MaoC/PaaZ C-terminal domain-containing protein [Acidimicrobiales bacterium]
MATTDNVERVVRAWEGRSYDASWTLKDTLLYALAVGARPSRELPFVYERYGPRVLSTFATRLAREALEDFGTYLMRAGFTTVLYSTSVESYETLRPECGDATTLASVGDLRNAGRHLLVELLAATTIDTRSVASIVHTIWVRDSAIEGLPSASTSAGGPDRAEAFRFEDEVRDEQYALWRLQENLSLDRPFPDELHIDPEYNEQHGFGPPFIPGECTLGFAGRAVVHWTGEDTAMTRMAARFRHPVVPGDRLITTVHRASNVEAAFEVHNQDGRLVLSDGSLTYAVVRALGS